jgi:hypothetical protein
LFSIRLKEKPFFSWLALRFSGEVLEAEKGEGQVNAVVREKLAVKGPPHSCAENVRQTKVGLWRIIENGVDYGPVVVGQVSVSDLDWS